jgi:hypothetical protein
MDASVRESVESLITAFDNRESCIKYQKGRDV